MMNPINILLLLDLEIIHPVNEFLLSFSYSDAHSTLSLLIFPTQFLYLFPIAILDLFN